jgi:hypothetical protein
MSIADANVVRTCRSGFTDNHATSGLKFQILRDFMSVGASVVLSDVDIVWVQSPFPYLYRDADVEGMTDGWDDPTAYGWEWVSGDTRCGGASDQSISQSVNQSVNQSINQSISPINQSNQSISQSIKQTINQSINQSLNQTTPHTRRRSPATRAASAKNAVVFGLLNV